MTIVNIDGPDGLNTAAKYGGGFFQSLDDNIVLTSDFSFIIWFRNPDTSAGSRKLFDIRGLTPDKDFYIELAGSNIYMVPGSGGIMANSFQDGNWHMVAVSRDNGIVKLWVDGEEEYVAAAPDTTEWGGTRIFIGFNDPAEFIACDIYDWRMYLKRMDTATLKFAYDDMILNGGANTLPPV